MPSYTPPVKFLEALEAYSNPCHPKPYLEASQLKLQARSKHQRRASVHVSINSFSTKIFKGHIFWRCPLPHGISTSLWPDQCKLRAERLTGRHSEATRAGAFARGRGALRSAREALTDSVRRCATGDAAPREPVQSTVCGVWIMEYGA